MGMEKERMMRLDEPSGEICGYCTGPIRYADLPEYHETGACSYCHHVVSKDD